MKILVINCGSSSLKYQLIDMQDESVLAKGIVERIGIDGSILTHKPSGKDKVVIKQPMKDHKDAIKLVLDALVDKNHGVIASLEDVSAVGHRVVHGGETYSSSVLIDETVKKALEKCNHLAPLHNPPNMIGIEACEALMPGVPMVAVFDTAFHQTMPDYAYMYALPYDLYEKYGIRKYGFHGTSHKYVAKLAAQMLDKNPEECKIITCHLGNGASVAAVDCGKVVDTSMGLTPLEGVIMGTRCGDIDPAIITFLESEAGYTVEQMDEIMNKKSGVYGVSGVSSDFRDVEDEAAKGNKRALLSLNMFYYSVKKYIGSYAAVMGGVDAVVFTAGLGENSAECREECTKGLDFLGIKVDPAKNKIRGIQADVSMDGSKVRTLVIPTNEELMIARDTQELVIKK